MAGTPGTGGAGPGGRLGPGQGTALLLGAVLGPGVLALPHLAAAAAGPASIVAWAALLALSAPVALTFAALGGRFPDGGGVAAFAARAFGARTAAVTGWWFYFAVPVGVPAGALIGAEYVSSALGLGAGGTLAVTCGLLAAAFAANHAGLRFSGGLQLLLAVLLVALLVAAVAAALPAVRPGNFTPFAPHGPEGVARAAGVLFFAFVGWEAASHLSAEFADPRRHLPRATVLTLAVVGVLYTGLAVSVIGVLGGRAAVSPVPLALLLEHGAGSLAGPVTAGAALLLSFGAINTYVAGGARLGAALARDGALPAWLAGGAGPARVGHGAGPARVGHDADPGRVPHRSLLLLAVLSGAVTAAVAGSGLGLDPLMRATSACLAAVTAVGVAAATRLLSGAWRRTAAVATVLTLALLAACGPYLLVPLVLAAGAAAAGRVRVRSSAAGRGPGWPGG
ncbi:amino acid permease [Planomonospora parontospora subsp. parontospora]|uniref:Amino acid permease n=2 Tax=Planomonospora parontospora TaxID=58119 RepID=A0AA37BJY5_9ACTN|nr:amino acid permease [Planomonospora parontospora]GGK82546.1 amino acid permease [Planomonospora parontospora]GII12181.1 amino acid permease [Planomonospora parontospora subsp. parontospora]